MMEFDPGEINERISFIEHYTDMSGGFPQDSKRVFRTVWAKVTRETGAEHLKGDKNEAQERIRVFLRESSAAGINSQMEILAGGKTYNIDYIHEYFRKGFLEILAFWRE